MNGKITQVVSTIYGSPIVYAPEMVENKVKIHL